MCIKFKFCFGGNRERTKLFFLECVLGSGAGFFFEPVADVAEVAAEDGGGLLDVAPEEDDGGAYAHHRHDEVGQRHLQPETLIRVLTQNPSSSRASFPPCGRASTLDRRPMDWAPALRVYLLCADAGRGHWPFDPSTLVSVPALYRKAHPAFNSLSKTSWKPRLRRISFTKIQPFSAYQRLYKTYSVLGFDGGEIEAVAIFTMLWPRVFRFLSASALFAHSGDATSINLLFFFLPSLPFSR